MMVVFSSSEDVGITPSELTTVVLRNCSDLIELFVPLPIWHECSADTLALNPNAIPPWLRLYTLLYSPIAIACEAVLVLAPIPIAMAPNSLLFAPFPNDIVFEDFNSTESVGSFPSTTTCVERT